MENVKCPHEDCLCQYRKKCKRTKGYRATRHHLYWVAGWYTTALERAFRNHPDNSVYLCRYEHDAVHRLNAPPPKPSVSFMLDFLAERAPTSQKGR